MNEAVHVISGGKPTAGRDVVVQKTFGRLCRVGRKEGNAPSGPIFLLHADAK
jgi:hypothetical protein